MSIFLFATRGWAQRVRMMPSSLSTYFSYTGSVLPDFIFIRKYFSKAILATCTQRPTLVQVTLRGGICGSATKATPRSEEHTSELQSLMRISYAVFCLKKKIKSKLKQ